MSYEAIAQNGSLPSVYNSRSFLIIANAVTHAGSKLFLYVFSFISISRQTEAPILHGYVSCSLLFRLASDFSTIVYPLFPFENRSFSSSQSLHPLYSSPLYANSFSHQPILSPYFPQNAYAQFNPSFNVKHPRVMQSVKFPFQRSHIRPKEVKPSTSTQLPFLMHLNQQPNYSIPPQISVGTVNEMTVDSQQKEEDDEDDLDPKSTTSNRSMQKESKELKFDSLNECDNADSHAIARQRGFVECERKHRSKSRR